MISVKFLQHDISSKKNAITYVRSKSQLKWPKLNRFQCSNKQSRPTVRRYNALQNRLKVLLKPLRRKRLQTFARDGTNNWSRGGGVIAGSVSVFAITKAKQNDIGTKITNTKTLNAKTENNTTHVHLRTQIPILTVACYDLVPTTRAVVVPQHWLSKPTIHTTDGHACAPMKLELFRLVPRQLS